MTAKKAAAKKPAAKKDVPLEDQSKADLEKLADKKDVDVDGTGSGGRVLKADLVDALGGKRETDADRDTPDAPEGAVSNPSLEQPPADKALDEVRQVRDQHERDGRFHNRTEIRHEVSGVSEADKDAPVVFLQTVGGRLYVSCTAKTVELDHDGVA